jgi:hypothetical protein
MTAWLERLEHYERIGLALPWRLKKTRRGPSLKAEIHNLAAETLARQSLLGSRRCTSSRNCAKSRMGAPIPAPHEPKVHSQPPGGICAP